LKRDKKERTKGKKKMSCWNVDGDEEGKANSKRLYKADFYSFARLLMNWCSELDAGKKNHAKYSFKKPMSSRTGKRGSTLKAKTRTFPVILSLVSRPERLVKNWPSVNGTFGCNHLDV
jgi:hypothetical protein